MKICPVNSAVKNDVVYTFHRDSPVLPPDVMLQISCAVNRVTKNGTQVICVTHSPQIAAIADMHLLVSKSESDGRTESGVHELTREKRETEIARIIGGATITEQTRAAARELLNEAESIRHTPSSVFTD